MNFFARLFLGLRPDVTRDWPVVPATTPAVDLRAMTIGPLRFGSPIADARIFGKPDERKGLRAKVDELLYARAGFVLEFQNARLSYVAFFIGQSFYTPEREDLIFSRPHVTLPNGATQPFTDELTAEALCAWFGPPASSEITDEASVLEWTINDVTLEAECDPQSRLKTINLFPSAS